MIRGYTNIEQSRKLAEILPLESADMYYPNRTDVKYQGALPIEFKLGNPLLSQEIAAWSLAALLDALPQSITKYIESERCQKTFHLNIFRSYYHCCSYSFSPSISDDDDNNTLYCIGRDNWVDACVAMVEKLHELKML